MCVQETLDVHDNLLLNVNAAFAAAIAGVRDATSLHIGLEVLQDLLLDVCCLMLDTKDTWHIPVE